MNFDTVSILEGNTFVVGRRNGDVDAAPGEPHGLFHRDTRHLSRWLLTIDGLSLAPLSTDDTKSFAAHFFLVPGTGSEYTDATLSVIRQRKRLGRAGKCFGGRRYAGARAPVAQWIEQRFSKSSVNSVDGSSPSLASAGWACSTARRGGWLRTGGLVTVELGGGDLYAEGSLFHAREYQKRRDVASVAARRDFENRCSIH